MIRPFLGALAFLALAAPAASALDGVEIVKAAAQQLSIGDLSATDAFQVVADADRTTAYGSEDDDQISLGSFGLLGPTFIQLVDPSLDRYLTIDGRGGSSSPARS